MTSNSVPLIARSLDTVGARYKVLTSHTMRILVIEDNEQVTAFLRKGLAEMGHVVDCADNGRDGMFLAASESYDSIILDRMLPGGIDGLGIISALRATGNKVPILILSALGEVDERIRG